MVKVKGQIDTPLIDMSHIREEYWQRKEVFLPSVAKFMPKKKVWFGLREDSGGKRSVNHRFIERTQKLVRETKALSYTVGLVSDKHITALHKLTEHFDPLL